jgi:hypothetical protein
MPFLCPSCQTLELDAEAVIKRAVLDFRMHFMSELREFLKNADPEWRGMK